MKKNKNITWEDLPKNIQKCMVKYYNQGFHIDDVNIKRAIKAYNLTVRGGFTWAVTPEGQEMWSNVLISGNFKFFKKYYEKKTTQYLIDYGYF